MLLDSVSRRKFSGRFASLFSALGAVTLMGKSATATPAPDNDEVRKLNDQGKPAEGTPFIMPIVAHGGLTALRSLPVIGFPSQRAESCVPVSASNA